MTPQATPRNCFRCGRDFPGIGGERICFGCRRPSTVAIGPELLGKPLSHRELQVVDLVSQGKLNKEIAFELHLAEGTIKEYLNRIFHKTGATNRTELAVRHLNKQLQPTPAE